LVAVYNDSGDAYAIGCEKFGLGSFFTKKIGQKPVRISGSLRNWFKPIKR